MIQTERPSGSPALNSEALWYDNKHNIIYCFGGDTPLDTPALAQLGPPPDSIWAFRPTGDGSGAWYQVLGPDSTPFPSDVHRISSGKSTSDSSSAYYLGGFGSETSSPSLTQPHLASHGLLIFDFDTLTMTNSSDDGYITFDDPSAMINIPTYGDNGVLVVLPSASESKNVGFDNITLYDKKNQKWYSQIASGDIPQPRSHFCAVAIEGDEKPYFEM